MGLKKYQRLGEGFCISGGPPVGYRGLGGTVRIGRGLKGGVHDTDHSKLASLGQCVNSLRYRIWDDRKC